MARKRKLYAIAKLNEISQQLEIDKDKALTLILEESKKKLHQYVQDWYDAYPNSQEFYTRTNEFIDCIQGRRNGDDEVEVYYDTTRVTASYGGDNQWNAHMSFDGSPFDGASIVEMLEFGIHGGSPNNPRFGDNGAQALQRLRGYLLSYVKKAVAQSFK